MATRRFLGSASLGLILAASIVTARTVRLRARHSQAATAGPAPIADAAMNGDGAAVRALLKKGVDVNAAQGDGMTALHWAAMKGDAEMAQMLVFAGANVRATTRLGAYTPLYLAAKGGHSAVVAALLAAGADAEGHDDQRHDAADDCRRGRRHPDDDDAGRERRRVNAKDTAKGETPLMFAAAFNRADAVKLLLARGADHKATTKVVDLFALTAPEEEAMLRRRGRQQYRVRRRLPGWISPAPRVAIATTS